MNLIISVVVFIVTYRTFTSVFSISLPYWHRSLGVLLLIIGVYIFTIGEYATGYKKGLDKGVNIATGIHKKHSN